VAAPLLYDTTIDLHAWTSERDAHMDDQHGKDAEPLPNRAPLAGGGRRSRMEV
jgi:hypothetical protein